MSDNIVINDSSSEYETSSSEEESESIEELNIQNNINLNTQYRFNERKTYPLILTLNSDEFSQFNKDLLEPFIIHKKCDIYLDNISTFGLRDKSVIHHLGLIINEFDIKNITNEGILRDTFVIPNDLSSTTADSFSVHKSKKLNYISTIQPKVLSNLSGSIFGINRDTTFQKITNINHASSTLSKVNIIIEFILKFVD